MDLKLACADYTFPLLPRDKALDLVSLLEFPAVSIGVFSGRSQLTPENILNDIAAAAKALSHKVSDRGLEIADVFYQAASFEDRAANHPDDEQRRQSRDLFQRMLEFALRCNSPHLTGLPGIRWEHESHDDSLKRCGEELAWRTAYAHRAGIAYSIEPHRGSVVSTPAEVHALLELAPELTLTLDYGHFIYQDISEDKIEPLVQHASHFHARCAAPRRLQTMFQRNTIDFARIVKEMARTNYPGFIEVEYVWIDLGRL